MCTSSIRKDILQDALWNVWNRIIASTSSEWGVDIYFRNTHSQNILYTYWLCCSTSFFSELSDRHAAYE